MVRYAGAGVLFGLVVAVGCSPPPQAGGRGEVAVKVQAAKAIERDNIDFEDYTGRTVPVESVDVRPQVTALIDKVFFKDGDIVQKGAQLYQLDDRTFKADLAQAESAIASSQARLEQYAADLARARRLRVGESISREELDKIAANKDEQQANLSANKAKADAARTNLQYTKITALITGLISKTRQTEGNLATANQTLLTNIVSVDTMRAEFDVDERTALRVGQRIADGNFPDYRMAKLPVLLGNQLSDDYPYRGTIDFVDNHLNPATGTLMVRGLFQNTREALGGVQPLRAGLFVRIRVPMGQAIRAVMVSEQAIVSDQDRKFVYVVGPDNKVQARPVKVGGLRDGLRVIVDGLKKDETVVLTGLQRLRPGADVSPTVVDMPAVGKPDLPANLGLPGVKK